MTKPARPRHVRNQLCPLSRLGSEGYRALQRRCCAILTDLIIIGQVEPNGQRPLIQAALNLSIDWWEYVAPLLRKANLDVARKG